MQNPPLELLTRSIENGDLELFASVYPYYKRFNFTSGKFRGFTPLLAAISVRKSKISALALDEEIGSLTRVPVVFKSPYTRRWMRLKAGATAFELAINLGFLEIAEAILAYAEKMRDGDLFELRNRAGYGVLEVIAMIPTHDTIKHLIAANANFLSRLLACQASRAPNFVFLCVQRRTLEYFYALQQAISDEKATRLLCQQALSIFEGKTVVHYAKSGMCTPGCEQAVEQLVVYSVVELREFERLHPLVHQFLDACPTRCRILAKVEAIPLVSDALHVSSPSKM